MMTVRPIIFSAPMVRALLAGRKTQTRRILKPQPRPFMVDEGGVKQECELALEHTDGEHLPRVRLGRVITRQEVRFAVGDRLWVRENFWHATSYPGTDQSGEPESNASCRGRLVHFAADGDPANTPNRHYPDGFLEGSGAFSVPDPYASWHLRPSIHMPRWASRLTLTVTAVRLQRLHAISEDDAVAEGARYTDFGTYQPPGKVSIDGGETWHSWKLRQHPGWHVTDVTGPGECLDSAREAFANLWVKINGPDAWDVNPVIAAITFNVHRFNIDHMPSATDGGGH